MRIVMSQEMSAVILKRSSRVCLTVRFKYYEEDLWNFCAMPVSMKYCLLTFKKYKKSKLVLNVRQLVSSYAPSFESLTSAMFWFV